MMQNSKRLLIVGAGAVGGFVGAKVVQQGLAVDFLVRGDHGKKIKKHGLKLVSVDEDLHQYVSCVFSLHQLNLPPDIILIAVKAYDTKEVIEQIKPYVSNRTLIVTLQNGLEHYNQLENAFGREHVIWGIIKVGARVLTPGVIEHSSLGKIELGSVTKSQNQFVNEVFDFFKEGNIDVQIKEDFTNAVWWKFCWNLIFNCSTALYECTTDELFMDTNREKELYSLYEELARLASTQGVTFTDSQREQMVARTFDLGAFKTSTYQDVIAGKRLEIDAFTGAALRLGQSKGVKLPAISTLHQSLLNKFPSRIPLIHH